MMIIIITMYGEPTQYLAHNIGNLDILFYLIIKQILRLVLSFPSYR